MSTHATARPTYPGQPSAREVGIAALGDFIRDLAIRQRARTAGQTTDSKSPGTSCAEAVLSRGPEYPSESVAVDSIAQVS